MVIICYLLTAFLIAVFGVIILSWFPMQPGTGLYSVWSFLRRITDPVLGPLRSAIPPIRLGAMALDLSPIIVIVGVRLLQGILC